MYRPASAAACPAGSAGRSTCQTAWQPDCVDIVDNLNIVDIVDNIDNIDIVVNIHILDIVDMLPTSRRTHRASCAFSASEPGPDTVLSVSRDTE